MPHVISSDGTRIAYDRQGGGPNVILVGGGLDDGSENAPLATELAESFTVYNYARRGRGESGDTRPYSVEREIEDIEAIIEESGGSAHLFGVSSGGALALEATAAGAAVDRIAVYEVPYGWPPPDFVPTIEDLLSDGRRGDAVELFMRSAGSSEEDIAGARNSPFWSELETIAHTLAYDAKCMRGGQPTARLAAINQPTLVMIGGVSPDSRPGMSGLRSDFFEDAANAIAGVVQHAERHIVEGSGHVPDPATLWPALTRFFTD